MNDVDNHLLEFGDKHAGFVFTTLDHTQFAFPLTCQFWAFKQFLVNNLYNIDARLGGDEVFLILANVASLEERLDDGCTRGWTTDAVLLHGFTK